jgi:protein-disulfide isomerase
MMMMMKMKPFTRQGWIALAALNIAFIALQAGAEPCPTPTPAKRAQVEAYVLAQYELSLPNVILKESKTANDACFWLFRYEVSGQKKQEISVYLSPDGKYLSPTLYDLSVDPMAEKNALRQSNLKALLEGVSPEIGPKDAPVTIVEFADFECPFCKRMADAVEKDFLPGETGHVRFVFKQFPLPMHPWAMQAAEMADCVALQKPSEFWKVHDFLFKNQGLLTADNLSDKVTQFVATNVAIDQKQYQFCVSNDLAMGPVRKDMSLGQSLGVTGTPSLVVNGVLYPGFKDADQIRALVASGTSGGETRVPGSSSTAQGPKIEGVGASSSRASTTAKR